MGDQVQSMQRRQYLLSLAFLPLSPFVAVLLMLRLNLLTLLTSIVNLFQGNAKRRSTNQFLQGNFAPVKHEVHEQNLRVEGVVPEALNGVFVRTGPNPYFAPAGDYHWFDGDGMLHACRIKNGSVSYCNRLVDTFKLAQERAAGAPIHMKLGDLRGFGGLAHIWLRGLMTRLGLGTAEHGSGTANTALVYHAKKLMTLHEGDLPYAARILCNGVIESLGRVEFDGKVDHPFTAHPKVDAETGELFFIGYKLDSKQPRLYYSGLDPDGKLVFDQCITLPHAVMHHDFAITQDYALIIDHCLEFDGAIMVKENRLPFKCNYGRNARIGVLPKRPANNTDKGANVRWFELPQPLVIFHTVNAWQEGAVIRLFACFFDKFDLDKFELSSAPQMGEIWLDTRTGQTGLKRLQPGLCSDFPRVRQDLIGKKTRYAFVSVMENSAHPMFRGIAKYDLEAPIEHAVVGSLSHGPHHGGGEAYFIPSHTDVAHMNGEDDGYLATFVHDEHATDGGTALVIYNAKTMADKPVARIPLPQRVPYGFHCHHMNEVEFQEHLQLPTRIMDQLAKP